MLCVCRVAFVLFVLQCVERCAGVGCVGMSQEVRSFCLRWNIWRGVLLFVLECVD